MKWNKITTPPSKDGKYYTVVGNGQVHILEFKNGKWFGSSYISKQDIAVTHWMVLPNPLPNELPELPTKDEWVSLK